MNCSTHDCQMEWMPNEAHPDGGSWFCEECFADEEAQYAESEDAQDELNEYLKNLNRIMNVGRSIIWGTTERFSAKARGRIRHARMSKGKHTQMAGRG